jgi:hypothetical protein
MTKVTCFAPFNTSKGENDKRLANIKRCGVPRFFAVKSVFKKLKKCVTINCLRYLPEGPNAVYSSMLLVLRLRSE